MTPAGAREDPCAAWSFLLPCVSMSIRAFRRAATGAVTTAGAAVALLLLAACGSDSGTAPTPPALFSTMVVFGASLDDTGNVCNLNPASCPPVPYFNGRVSNGPLWVELVAQRVGATVTPSRTGGTNYAHSGARTGAVPGTTQGVPNMMQQVDTYLASGSTANRDRALFVVNAATVGNDINDALTSTNAAAATIVPNAVNNAVAMVAKLYQGGARHVLLVNSTDIGKTPLVRAGGPQAMAAATNWSTFFNTGVGAQLTAIRSSSPGLTLYYMDLGALTTEVLAAPGGFGFSNVTAPCVAGTSVCTTPDAFFYWDGFHPTAATGRLVSQRALALLGR
jgi:outer membrane lipase/esterase